MTTVYFMTATKEKEKAAELFKFFEDKTIDVIYSSPFGSAVETIREYGVEKEIPMFAVTEFGELDQESTPAETMEELEERMIDGLAMLAANEEGNTILVCTHPIALSSAIHFFDETFGEEDTKRLKEQGPALVKFTLDGEICKDIEEIKVI